MVERRRSPRFSVRGVRGSLEFSASARVLNLSLTGASLETGSYLRVGERYAVRLAHEGATLRLPAETVWSHLRRSRAEGGASGSVYEVGLRFVDLDEGQQRTLRQLLGGAAVVAVGDGEEAAGAGELRPAEAGEVSLEGEHELAVLKVSAWGLLAEAEVAPALGSPVAVRTELGDGAFVAHCRVAYVKQLERGGCGPQRYQLGIEIVSAEPASRRVLEAFIASRLG